MFYSLILAQVPIGPTFGGYAGTFGSITNTFINSAMTAAGVAFLFSVVIFGIKFISTAGNNDPRAVGQTRTSITFAFVGFLLVFLAYWLLTLIEYFFGVGNFLTRI